MSSYYFLDNQLKWADAVTVTNTTLTSLAFRLGKTPNLTSLFVCSALTAASIATVVITNCNTVGGTYTEVARGVITGITGGGPVTLAIPFSCYRQYIKVAVTTGAGVTAVFSGFFTESNSQDLTEQLV